MQEIREELGCTITVGERVTTTVHEYENVIVDLTTYWATITHADLHTLCWAPADVEAVEWVVAVVLRTNDAG